MKDTPKTTVYYNSACPVCDAGIASQKSKMQACNIAWVDVHTRPEAALELDAELESVRERLHVRDETGHVAIGATALVALWERTPGQQPWGRMAKWPVIRALLPLAYNAFAKCLYRWNRWKKHW